MQPQSHASTPAGSAPSNPLFNNAVPVALKSLIDRYGATLTGEAPRLRGLLQDECPQAKKEISVLLQALEQRVPQDLLRVHSGEPIQSLSSRLAKRLSDEKAMSPAASQWAVQAWAHGMGVESALFSGGSEAADLWPDESAPAAAITAANEPLIASSITAAPALADPRVRLGLIGGAIALIVALAWWMLTPKLEITRIETQGPFVGNGKPTPVFVEFEARNAAPQSVEVRFLRGDGSWQPAAWKHEVGSATGTRADAGSLQYRTKRPASATFEYVLVSADGKRSAPFERTFDITPPVTITGIRVPRPLRVGHEFALTIGYEKGAADIVRIERRVVETSVPWKQSESAQEVKLGGSSGSFDYKFDAAMQPMRSTLEFVMVDAQGLRSEPARVVLDIGTPPAVAPGGSLGTVMSVAQVTEKGQATGLGAVIGGVIGGVIGTRFGGGHGRDATTVAGVAGGAYAGHEVEKNIRGTSTWNTTVRFDNGSLRVIRTTGAPRWRSGERVSFVNGVLSPAP
jgi:outer membrane lipoprotein SlyB